MENGPKFTLIGSGIVVIIAIVVAIVGLVDIEEIDVEAKASFKGTEGSIEVVTGGAYTVFVNDEFTCQETTISVNDGTYEYFESDCDSDFDEEGWRSIGVFYSDVNGELDVQSNHEILIIDDIVYLEEGGDVFIGGCCFVCIGLIGLIAGAIWAYSSKGQTVPQMVIMPQQQQVPMQVPLATTTEYTPGDLVITQLEEEHDV
jgi:hypothetical protein